MIAIIIINPPEAVQGCTEKRTNSLLHLEGYGGAHPFSNLDNG